MPLLLLGTVACVQTICAQEPPSGHVAPPPGAQQPAENTGESAPPKQEPENPEEKAAKQAPVKQEGNEEEGNEEEGNEEEGNEEEGNEEEASEGEESESSKEPDADASVSDGGIFAVHGNAEVKYRGRATGSHTDNDLYVRFSLDAGDSKRDPVTLHASGRFALDLDGSGARTDPLRSIDDSYSKDLTARLYTAHVDLEAVEGGFLPHWLRRVRVGRQVLYDTPQTLFMDGTLAETAPLLGSLDFVGQAYFGVPTNLFESSPSGDLMYGVAGSWAAWTDSRLRLDYTHIQDDYLGSSPDDDLLGLRWDQDLGDNVSIDSRLTMLEFDPRDLDVGLTWTVPDADLTATARYSSLLRDEHRHAIELDTFTPLLQTLSAYDQGRLTVSKGFGDHLWADAGLEVRELRGAESTFNHEFRRYWLAPGTADWPWDDLQASVTFELWDSAGDRFTAIGGELTQDFDERWRGTIGTLFQLYRYDALVAQENENVQVSYARLRYRPTETLTLRTDVEFEDGEIADYFSFTLRAQYDF